MKSLLLENLCKNKNNSIFLQVKWYSENKRTEQKDMVITICGGGNLGHVCAGYLATQNDVEVRVLTRKPSLWRDTISVTDSEGKVFEGKLSLVTDDAKIALNNTDIVLLCLPGFSIEEELIRIKPYLETETAVGSVVSSTGFFFRALEILPKNQTLFGFQRVPFICRIKEYGHSADLLGYKPSLNVAIEQTETPETLRQQLETLFNCPVNLLNSHYEVSLTNSNPLLHTSRLFTVWKNHKLGVKYERNLGFYSEWTDEASETFIAMDEEFQSLLKKLGVREGAIPMVLNYYESHDASSLTAKLRSIKAFKGLLFPMKEIEGGFVPDFDSRYFTEDFPFGLRFIVDLARQKEVSTPVIDKVFEWGMSIIGKQ